MLKNLWNLLRNKSKQTDLLVGENCYLKPLVPEDAKEVTHLLRENRDYWSRFEPRHVDQYFTIIAQYNKLIESQKLRSEKKEYFYGIYECESNQLIGQISLYNFKGPPFQSCFIGYALDEKFTGKGITTESVRLLVEYAITSLKVNRIQAYVSPKNGASIRVLEKEHFEREGLLKQLLCVNGKWEDYFIYAVTANNLHY